MTSVAWFKDITDPQIRQHIEELLQNETFKEVFLKIIDELEAQEERIIYKLTTYDSPSWAYKQADLNGAKRAYRTMRALISKDS